jgi:hypothetical protein
MSEVLQHPIVSGTSQSNIDDGALRSYLPAVLPIIGAIAVVMLRATLGGKGFISDGALVMIALASYMTAAVFLLTNLYAPSSTFQRIGVWLMSFGAFTNLSAWGVRWLAGRDRELEIIMREGGETPWFFRHIPLQNLYDFSIAFAFGAGITTLFIARRRSFSFLGALSLPLLSLILLLAIFIGDEFINLPPILDSYWRPIHVGTASLSYGVALVCFAVGVLYLLKDGVRPEAMAITSSIFVIGVIGSISNFPQGFTAPRRFSVTTRCECRRRCALICLTSGRCLCSPARCSPASSRFSVFTFRVGRKRCARGVIAS